MKTVQFKLNGRENILRQIRLALGLTQEEFGKLFCVGRLTIIRWENGQREPTFTLPQIKALQLELLKLGLDFQDLPDNWNVEIKSEPNKKRRKAVQKKAS
jgi:putative transcriptional regulator